MGLFHLEKIFGIKLRESADDGSDFSNPDADYRLLYLGEDGDLHLKDSSGSVTDIGGGGGSGALVLLEQQTASNSATLDFTTFISATYDTYKIIGTDLAPATDAVHLTCRVGTGGGPTYDTGSNYEWGYTAITSGGVDTKASGGGASAAVIASSIDNNSGYGVVCFELTMHQLQSTAHRKFAHGTATWTNSTPALVFASGGFHWVTDATAVTALRFLMSSGNIASGTIRAYGIVK